MLNNDYKEMLQLLLEEKDRLIITVDDINVPVISVEGLIRNKQTTARPKDLLDLECLRNRLINQ